MKLTFAFLLRWLERIVIFSAVSVLMGSSLAVVYTQYKARALFVEIERANDVTRRLSDDASQLALDLSRAALPSQVNERAVAMGFHNATVKNTIMLPIDSESRQTSVNTEGQP